MLNTVLGWRLNRRITFGNSMVVPCLNTLSPQVRKRVEALKNVQSERDALEALFLNEKAVLEAKYEKLHESLYIKSIKIVNGVVEVEGDNMGTRDEKGVPNFCLTAMKAFEIYEDEMKISPRDEEALKFLKDIKCCRVDHPKGFKLDFFFDTNPFFKNSVLTKTCHNSINKDMAKYVTWMDIE